MLFRSVEAAIEAMADAFSRSELASEKAQADLMNEVRALENELATLHFDVRSLPGHQPTSDEFSLVKTSNFQKSFFIIGIYKFLYFSFRNKINNPISVNLALNELWCEYLYVFILIL